MHLLCFHSLKKALILFSVQKFHKVQFKAVEESGSNVALSVIGVRSREHQLSESLVLQRREVVDYCFSSAVFDESLQFSS